MLDAPPFKLLEDRRSILIAGAGGGFDVYSGLPLYFALRSAGRAVHLANLTFSALMRSCSSTEASTASCAVTKRSLYLPRLMETTSISQVLSVITNFRAERPARAFDRFPI